MFVSFFSFLFFLGIIIFCFFCLPSKWRVKVLLAGSYVFCGVLSLRALLVLVIVSLVVWRTGFSFYFFQAISYLVDVYQRKCTAEKRYYYLGVYFAFFCKIYRYEE